MTGFPCNRRSVAGDDGGIKISAAGAGEKPAEPAIWPRVTPGDPTVEAGRWVYYRAGCAACA